jgi:hypothetical protein
MAGLMVITEVHTGTGIIATGITGTITGDLTQGSQVAMPQG